MRRLHQFTFSADLLVALGLSVGLGAHSATGQDPDQPMCEPCSSPHVLPTLIPPDDCTWIEERPFGAGTQRVAIVVWDARDAHGYGLYDDPDIEQRLNTYAADVAASGYSVGIFRFYGMAEDPDHSDAHDLRWQLRHLYDPSAGTLSGAVLVGDIPTLTYEVW
jgi:hypothetical protein